MDTGGEHSVKKKQKNNRSGQLTLLLNLPRVLESKDPAVSW